MRLGHLKRVLILVQVFSREFENGRWCFLDVMHMGWIGVKVGDGAFEQGFRGLQNRRSYGSELPGIKSRPMVNMFEARVVCAKAFGIYAKK